MYRVRLHGRGGQGIKTASRMLGTALFEEGFQVQDAPRYGAERRGAPIFAYVRAAHGPVHERGIIRHPDLVVVADDSLVPIPAAGVRMGIDEHSVLLIRTRESADTWIERLRLPCRVCTLPAGDVDDRAIERLIGAQCAGAAARLLGVVSRTQLEQALRAELAGLDDALIEQNLGIATAAFDAMAPDAGTVKPKPVSPSPNSARPDWVTLDFEPADVSAPTIHAGATSVEVRTGLWRTMRPVIDRESCHRCNWMCALPCPDNAIEVDDEGYPHVDLDHCKGCMICVAQCPFHVISAIPEHEGREADAAKEAS